MNLLCFLISKANFLQVEIEHVAVIVLLLLTYLFCDLGPDLLCLAFSCWLTFSVSFRRRLIYPFHSTSLFRRGSRLWWALHPLPHCVTVHANSTGNSACCWASQRYYTCHTFAFGDRCRQMNSWNDPLHKAPPAFDPELFLKHFGSLK